MAPDLGQGVRAYRRVQLESMAPGELVLLVYDVAIQACESRDMKRAGEAVTELMSGLDFTYEDPAGKLVVIYDWVFRQIREGKFDEARSYLVELRETWSKVIEAEAAAKRERVSSSADSTG